MLAEIGNLACITAFAFAMLLGLAPNRYHVHFLALRGQCCFSLIALMSLMGCFVLNDMTVIYVREHSNLSLDLIYRLGATWGGHEGSVLLWCTILSCWALGFYVLSKPLSECTRILSIRVLGLVSAGFFLFLLATSNPFLRDFPITFQTGRDLTPLLQDPGLLFHPPMLYFGYVGFAIPFALAIAALIEAKIDNGWIEVCRNWLMLAWSLLSIGIVLGSWWAYRELGWGGWWFWDPVENASLLPWLSATALLHSLLVNQKRQVFFSWSILLALICFALSLLGTFLVRSGVLVSVHAFANDPSRGIYLLVYLTAIVGSAFSLYALRAHKFYQAQNFAYFSRETLLLINTVIMLIAVSTILLGTLYPILLDSLGLAKLSIGEPYYNLVFIPIMIPLLIIMAIAPHVNWRQQSFSTLRKKIRFSVLLSFLISLVLPYLIYQSTGILVFIGFFIASLIMMSTLKTVFNQHPNWPMILAHMGIAILILGVTINKHYSQERQVKIAPGETVEFAGYTYQFKNLKHQQNQNYQSEQANFSIIKNNKVMKTLRPEQRIYKTEHIAISKTATDINIFRDLYIALGQPLDNHNWSVRLYYKPFVRWIWAGGFLLAIGGLLSLLRRKKIKGLL